ncbi:MAG: pantoate--beta-alanine ligase [Desulfomonilaceae bacterium]|nr:pantoate--beta-alanine ligase [Desulfomonilaceae bacterium]
MDILTTVHDLRDRLRPHRQEGRSIGLVPTMGYLHEGHLSLMRRGRSENDVLVATIFVNPTQFGPNEDLDKYPRDPEGDAEKCRSAGVDILFVPEPGEVYGPQFQTYVTVERVSAPLCGASRPGHFRGVATVVLKLFNMVQPTDAYFGGKDYQQVQVIKTMARDLNLDVRIVECDTIREDDGLAMSSRNAYLSPDRRRQAVCLYEALMEAKGFFKNGANNAEHYLAAMRTRVNAEPDTEVDYISIVHPDTLEDLAEVGDKALAILAVRIGSTRLIDNMLLHE